MAFQFIYGLAFREMEKLGDLRKAFMLSPYRLRASEHGAGGYSWKLIRGVWEHADRLDALIDQFSHNWRIERMGKIELTLLRLALYEMLYEDLPARIVISETMDIADMFGVEEAKKLVNGILDAISKSPELPGKSGQRHSMKKR